MAFQKAVKSKAKLRLTFDGPAGSGKTYSSLVLATELGGSIAVIDTEHRTASKYAGIFSFDQESPDEFSLDTYLKLIRQAKDYDVLIVDSLSHAWMGKGGAMEEVDRSGGAAGNKFAGWRSVTPKHNELIDAIIGFPGHVICTMRKKMEYVLETDSKGRQVPKKVGMAPVQREGMEYEFDVVADLDTDGTVTIAKTRCPDLHAKRNQFRHSDVPELGKILKTWLSDGAAVTPPAPPATPKIDTSKLVAAFASLGVTTPQLEERIKKPLPEATEENVNVLRAWYAEKRNTPHPAADYDPGLAQRIEQEKAEAGIKAEAAIKAGKDPRFVAFETILARMKAAKTSAEVILIHAEVTKEKLLTDGDKKALQRSATDRQFILDDAAKRSAVIASASSDVSM